MSCNIKGNRVLDNNGKPSKLFNALEKRYGYEQALEMFKASHSDQFVQIYGSAEPSINTLEEFLSSQNRVERELTAQETQDLRNSLIGFEGNSEDFKAVVQETLFENGVFTVKESPIYSEFELSNLQADPELQKTVKETMQALQNTQVILPMSDFEKGQIEYSSTVNSFGKLNKLNPNKVKQDVLEQVAGTTREQYDQIMQTLPYDKQHVSFEEAQQYVKADILVDADGNIETPSLGNTLAQVVDVEKARNLPKVIESLLNTSDETLLANSAPTRKILEYIEKESAKAGIDIIGISNQVDNPALKPLLSSMSEMIIEPIQENVSIFASVHNDVFPDLIQKTKAIRQENTRDYVVLDTNQNEGDVYDQANLLKIGENLYIRVNDKSLEDLYAISGTPISQNQRDASSISATNRETAEKINLLRKIFSIEPVAVQAIEMVQEGTFSGDFNYLTNQYISDFYSKFLQEKQKDSILYQNFYSNFEVNERGINLKYTDSYTLSVVDTMADDNLRQYSLLSKQMPTLTQQQTDDNPEFSQMQRDFYMNNPQQAPILTSGAIILEDGIIAVKNYNESFTRMNDGSLWENTQSLDGFNVFVKLPALNLDYNVFGTPRPFYENFSVIPQEDNEINIKKENKIKNQDFLCN